MRMIFTVSIFLVVMFFSFSNTTQSTLLNELVNHYDIDLRSQSYISSLISIGMLCALFLILTGAIRLKKPIVLFGAVGLCVIMFALFGFAPPYIVLLIFYYFVGISYGFIDTSASSAIADLYTGKKAALYMGILHSFFGIGGVVGPIIIQAMTNSGFVWNEVMRIFSLVGAIICVLGFSIYIFTKKDIDRDIRPAGKISLSEFREFLNKKNIILMVAVALRGSCDVCLAFWMSRYITTGLDGGFLGPLAISLLWLGSSVSRIIVPLLPVKINTYIIVSMFSMSAILIIALIFANPVVLCIASLAVGLITGAIVPQGLSELCGRNKKNTLLASSITLMAIYISQALFLTLAGIIFPNYLSAGILVSIGTGIIGAFAAIIERKINIKEI